MNALLLTVEEAAVTLRCGRTKVFELIRAGVLVRGTRYGRQAVVLAESVFAACEAAAQAAPAPVKRKRVKARETDADFDALLAEERARR